MRKTKLDVTIATQDLARLTAKFLANDEDADTNLQLERLENIIKEQYPNRWKDIDRTATNLALGHREQ